MTGKFTPPSGVLPHLVVRGAARAIAFYTRALGAKLEYDLKMDDGRVGHSELTIGDRLFMLTDEFPELEFIGPEGRGGTTVGLMLYVDDVDRAVERAITAGAELERPIKDEFYGDRVAHIRDPFGHRWALHTRIEDVSPDEMRRRMASGGA